MAVGMRKPHERVDQVMANCTRPGETGFALVLALLALMLLTTLGITLATTTATEMQIATNFRWGLQAKYNAEAGIEVGKRYLRQVDWRAILPAPRSSSDIAGGTALSGVSNILSRSGPEGEPSRNHELEDCDTWGLTGLGVILDDPNQTFPFQSSSDLLGSSLSGTFTLWIRRPLDFEADGSLKDYEGDDKVILVSEGTAPYSQGGATGNFQLRNKAVRFMQVELSRQDPTDCENRSGQIGSGPGGANFDNCDAITDEGVGLGAQESDTAAAGV